MEIIRNKNKDYSIKLFVGGIFFIIGLAMLHVYIGYALIAISISLMTYKSGISIDLDAGRIREFWSLFGVQNGTWMNLSRFDSISIKPSKKGIRRYGATNNSIDTSEQYYNVLIVNSKQRSTQLCLYSLKDRNKALLTAEEWCTKLKLPYVHYGKRAK